MSRIITVFGATGRQGGSVVNSLLEDGTFTPRAVARDPSSEAALKLKSRGVEVVQADLASEDTTALDKALAGSEGVFGFTLTPQLEPMVKLVEAAKRANVKLFVFSSLPNASEISHGKYTGGNYFKAKVAQAEYLKKSGLPWAIAQIGGFADIILTNINPMVEGADGVLEIPAYRYTPTALYTTLWAGSGIGRSVLALFKNYEARRDEVVGQEFAVASHKITYPDFAAIISQAIGRPVRVIYPENKVDPFGLGLNEMYDYLVEFGSFGKAPIPDPKLVNLGVKFASLEEFATEAVKPKFA